MSVLEYNRSINPQREPKHSEYHGPSDSVQGRRADYTGPEYSYRFNDQGFRSPELTANDPCVVSFGCSVTMGQGVPEEKRFANLVAERYNLNHYCFAAGGSDNLCIFKNFTSFLHNNQEGLDTRLVVILWSFPSRVSICRLDARGLPWERTLVNQDSYPEDDKLADYHLGWIKHSADLYTLQFVKAADVMANLAGLKIVQLCIEEIKTPYRHIDSFYSKSEWYKYPSPLGVVDLGRDQHPGMISHQNIADIINNICDLHQWRF